MQHAFVLLGLLLLTGCGRDDGRLTADKAADELCGRLKAIDELSNLPWPAGVEASPDAPATGNWKQFAEILNGVQPDQHYDHELDRQPLLQLLNSMRERGWFEQHKMPYDAWFRLNALAAKHRVDGPWVVTDWSQSEVYELIKLTRQAVQMKKPETK